ncbi:hypothetical protein HK100_007065 [Physocladia obscura]|uniref:PH domain-containing protein n=1 Tax=Physocladia obscura TaxID=109957 RepID=A0AAD5SVF7_9FUNG|nr:hypothetical protein HK100_007065 [Physocladia obscura]
MNFSKRSLSLQGQNRAAGGSGIVSRSETELGGVTSGPGQMMARRMSGEFSNNNNTNNSAGGFLRSRSSYNSMNHSVKISNHTGNSRPDSMQGLRPAYATPPSYSDETSEEDIIGEKSVGNCVLMSGTLAAPRRTRSAFGNVVSNNSNNSNNSSKHLLLAHPLTTGDIQFLYERIFLRALPVAASLPAPSFATASLSPSPFTDGLLPDISDPRVCLAFGHITKAAVEQSPVFIVLDNSPRAADAPTFFYLNCIDSFVTEVELSSPGTFAFRMGKHEHRFSAASSIEYQSWEAAFLKAMDIVATNKQSVRFQKSQLYGNDLADSSNDSVRSANNSALGFSANNNWSDMDSARSSMTSVNTIPISMNRTSSSVSHSQAPFSGEKMRAVGRKSLNSIKNTVMAIKGFGGFFGSSKGHSRSFSSQSQSSKNSIDMQRSPLAGEHVQSGYANQTANSSPTTITSFQQQKQQQQHQQHQKQQLCRQQQEDETQTVPEPIEKSPIISDNFTQDVLRSLIYDHNNNINLSKEINFSDDASMSPIAGFSSQKRFGLGGGEKLYKNMQPPFNQFELSPYVEFPSYREDFRDS